VIINKLLPNSLIHSSQGVIGTSKVLGEVLDSILHEFLNSNTLVPGDSRRKTKSINGATNTDSAGVDRDIFSHIALQLSEVHVRGVSSRWADSMVFLDKRVEDRGKVLV